MNKVTASELIFPGICRICDRSPKENQEFVDTEYEYYDNGDDVNGRIYVCDECIHALADKLGYVHEKTFKYEMQQFELEIKRLRAFQSEVAQLMNPDKKETKIALA